MSIKIKSISTDNLTKRSLEQSYLYKDLDLDLNNEYSFNNKLNKQEYQHDVSSIYDIESVKNSIRNHFLTSPGQKILNPLFGIDLRRFLFEPVDDFTAEIIQEDINTKLPRSETRVKVSNVTVFGNEETHQYDVTLQIDVPTLGLYGISLKYKLDTVGYTII